MSTYRTGLQIDNKTPMAIVSGRITYSSNDFADNGIPNFFTNPQTSTEGKSVTVTGTMNIQPGAWADNYIEIYEGYGYVPISIQLAFSNGHWIQFDDLQRRAYDEVPGSHPLPVAVDQPGGAGVADRMGVAYWTRHDEDIKKRYKWGLLTYTVTDESRSSRWMGTLDPQRKISEITLPGTHDSGTWPLSGNAQCQTRNIRQQLDAGIRFLDIRLEKLVVFWMWSGNGWTLQTMLTISEDLDIYHGPTDTGLTFKRDVLPACKAFLEQNPSETIVMMISRNRILGEVGDENSARVVAASDELFVRNVDLLIPGPQFLRATTIPTLDEAKGKIVLMTRYKGGPGIPWQSGVPDDAEGAVTEAGNRFYIQDVYGYGFPDGITDAKKREKLDKKWSFIESNLARASQSGRQGGVWWINYASATGFPVLDPVDFAYGVAGGAGMDARLADYLKAHPKGYYGTVPMDFPDAELIQRLIESNR